MTRRLLATDALFWWALLIVTWALSTWSFDFYKALDARWIIKYPTAWRLPMEASITSAINWLMEQANFGLFTFRDVTRAVAALIEAPYEIVRNLLIDGFAHGFGESAVQIAPPLSWIAIIVTLVAIAHYARDWRLAGLVGACFAYLAVFGQWESAMVTLASVLIAVPIGAMGGLALGILAFRFRWVERALRPVLDLMQTVPVFAYLVPILILFGFGPVAALVATVIYAMPPMVRVTIVALQGVPPEIVEVGHMSGCTKRQMMWKLLVPSALPTLMVGVNQVIMLSLNMVIIASMIGAGGLGYDVLASLRRLDIGAGIEAGLAIVVMAIALDRLSQAFSERTGRAPLHVEGSVIQRHPWLATTVLVVLGTLILGVFLPPVQTYPEALTVTTGPSLLGTGNRIHQRQLLRHVRNHQDLLPHLVPPTGETLFRTNSLALGDRRDRSRLLAGRRLEAGNPRRAADGVHRRKRPLGKSDGDGLSLWRRCRDRDIDWHPPWRVGG